MEIPEIKQHLPIQTALNYYGIKPNKNNMAKCPFHEDDKPSLQIYPKTNTWHCFGCGKGTDTIDLIKYIENCTTHEAIIKAKSLSNINLKPMETTEEIKPLTGPKRILAMETAFKYFVQSLKETTKAQEYLKSRNIDYTKIIAGHDNNNYHQIKKTGKELQELYLQLGLIFPDRQGRKDSYHSRFDGCIVFPTFDEQGNIVNMYGRKIEVKEGEGGHYKLPGEHQGLYPKYPDPNTEILLITECIIDAATLLQHEFITEKYTLLSLYGAKIWTEEHTKAIQNLHQLKEIIFALDGDKEGREGTQKHSETVKQINSKIKISYIEIPEGEDINSIAQSHEPSVFTELINHRKEINTITKFFFSKEKKENSENGWAQELEQNRNINSIEIKTKKTLQPHNGQELHQSEHLNTKNPYKIIFKTNTAAYYIKGGVSKMMDSMRVTLETENNESKKKFRDKAELYEYKQVERYAGAASEKLNLRKDLLEQDVNRLIDLLDEYREKLQEQEEQKKPEIPILSESEKQEYKRFGKEKELLKKINELIEKSGIVGENQNRLFLFTTAVSHKMQQPLHVVVQGSSGSGKSYLIKKISNLMPQESVKRYTRLSEKSFYNFGEYDLCHKLLIVEDYDGLNEEVEYAFRELQSDGQLVSAVSWKENDQSKVETKDKIVRGPIASIVATTRGEIYHDNSTRVFFIRIDESAEQTSKIIAYQNKKANGEIREEEEQRASQYLQWFVRSLQSYRVRNPWLKHIRLPVPSDQQRRLHEMLEGFSNQITLLHQHQRSRTPSGEIIAEKQDMKVAIALMFDSIALKADDLNGQLREFFEKLKGYVQQRGKEYEFKRIEIRQALEISKSKQHEYITKLQELEYIQQKGGYGNRGYTYKIIYWDDNEAMRGRIKKELEDQLKNIAETKSATKTEHHRTPAGTPELLPGKNKD